MNSRPCRVMQGESEKDMRLNDEYNLKFMNHPDRVSADNRLRNALKHIEEIKTLSAQTILYSRALNLAKTSLCLGKYSLVDWQIISLVSIICMPPALKELQNAYENLNIVEAKIESELLKEQAAG